MMDPALTSSAPPKKKKRRDSAPVMDEKGFRLRSGCFPIRLNTETNTMEVLLITSRADPTRYDVSAGGIDPGEIAAEAAMRGTRERAGVVGRLREPERPLGVWTTRDRQTKTSIFVLDVLQELDNWDEQQDRKRKWFSVPEAEEAVRWNPYTVLMFNSLKARLATPLYAIPPPQTQTHNQSVPPSMSIPLSVPSQSVTSSATSGVAATSSPTLHHIPSPATVAIASDLRQLASSGSHGSVSIDKQEGGLRSSSDGRVTHSHNGGQELNGSPSTSQTIAELGLAGEPQHLMRRAAAVAEEMGVLGLILNPERKKAEAELAAALAARNGNANGSADGETQDLIVAALGEGRKRKIEDLQGEEEELESQTDVGGAEEETQPDDVVGL